MVINKDISIMLEEGLQKHFGFSSFRKGQREVISKIVAHQSAAAIFPTGSGKSLCYQLPAMLLPHLTLVVSPLLALMKDQIDFLVKLNIPAARLDSTLSKDDYDHILGRAKNGELKILMISVERFRNERFRAQLQRMKMSLLVVDEAHCISEWGHNFRPEYMKLPVYQKEFGIQQVLLLTATATEQVIEDVCVKFNVLKENVTVTGFYRSNLFLQVTPTPESQKQARLLSRICESPKAATIVYVSLQKTAEHISEFLHNNSINSFPYHAGMDTAERERVQNEFLAGGIDCVVATIAFGMGIDKSDIRRVIHYDLPKSIENYSQEIGRSGRDGKPSFCEVLANRDNISVLENFIYGDTPGKEAIRKLLQKIQNHQDTVWEIKLNALTYELNIRMLPLKTLLVYLDMEGIVRPRYTYFEEYVFKYQIEQSEIIDKFEGERKYFVQKIFNNCRTKKIWTYVDMQGIVESYDRADRQRVITALEYFSEKGWIELQSKQAIEAYEIMNRSFDIDVMSRKIYRLFEAKENHEIQRIHNMVDFFESAYCISKRLAGYFGEDIKKNHCGYCSFCKAGQAVIEHTIKLQPLNTFSFNELTDEFIAVAGDHYSALNVTKFLCGISSPFFIKLNIKKLVHFGIFERYPFLEVKTWADDCGHENENHDKRS
ncbi:MAG: RecQ family ATP-dependent DNA helicase [Pseudomonadota bacterium]